MAGHQKRRAEGVKLLVVGLTSQHAPEKSKIMNNPIYLPETVLKTGNTKTGFKPELTAKG